MHVMDEPRLLQRFGNEADGWTLDTEHHGEKLMTQMEILFVHPVVGHQQPASAALVHLMERVAGGRLHHLRDDHMGVPSNEVAECSGFSNSVAEILHPHRLRTGVGHLYQRFASR